MKYRNTKTGAVIDVPSKITGGNWQAVESAKEAVVEKTEEAPAKKKTKKNK